jgi:lipopolysaccharide transport system ATP-binding protein
VNAVSLQGVGKAYVQYAHHLDRLLEVLTGRPRHREFHALRDLSLDIAAGEVLGVVGRNGAGKSTLLKLVTGTATPSAGRVAVHGRVAALLELGGGFHPEMSGRDNVFLSGAVMGLSQPQIERLYPAIVEFAGIAGFMDQPVKTYSSGMFVRLAFAVATCVEPDILVIDEALSVGDGAFARKSFERIKAIRDRGRTILFCSHSMYQVEAICTRVIWLEQGRVRMDGPPAEVVSAYNAFLATEEAEREMSAGAPAVAGAAPAPVAPRGSARLAAIAVAADGRSGKALELETGRSDLAVTVRFESDPALPCPSVALVFNGEDQRTVASAGTHNDGFILKRSPDGRGEVRAIFPAFPLLKGGYTLDVYLLCENAVHLYDHAIAAAELRVRQRGLEQGVVSLAHRWEGSRPRGRVARITPSPLAGEGEGQA